jgi:hypothetical protein
MEKLATSRAGIWYDFFNKVVKLEVPLKIADLQKRDLTPHRSAQGIITADKEKISLPENVLVGILQDMCFEEKCHLRTLSKIGSLVTTPELKGVFSENIKATEEQLTKLEKTIELMDKASTRSK